MTELRLGGREQLQTDPIPLLAPLALPAKFGGLGSIGSPLRFSSYVVPEGGGGPVGSPESSPWVLLTLTGELDMSRTEELDEMVAAAMDGDQVDVIVDLSEVTFMDSSALRWLLKVQERTDRVSGRLRLVALDGGSPLRILALSGLDDQFAVFGTTVEAQGAEGQPDEVQTRSAGPSGSER